MHYFKLLFHTFFSGFFVLLAMAIYTGVTVNYYGKRYGNWRFSWSYIMGWVSVVLTFFSGIAYCIIILHKIGQTQCLVYKVITGDMSCRLFRRYVLHVCLSDAWTNRPHVTLRLLILDPHIIQSECDPLCDPEYLHFNSCIFFIINE